MNTAQRLAGLAIDTLVVVTFASEPRVPETRYLVAVEGDTYYLSDLGDHEALAFDAAGRCNDVPGWVVGVVACNGEVVTHSHE